MMAASPRPRSTDGLYEKLVNSLGGIVWEADPRTFQFSFVSPQAESILGYPVREWLSDAGFWRRHTHPDDVDWCTAFCLDATAHGRDHQFEYRMIAADGRVVWLRDVVTLTVDEHEEPRLRGIMLDITERKHAEEELRRSEARYRSLVSATAQSIWTADARGNAYQDAPWWRALSGQAIEEIADDGWLDVVHPEDRERVRQSWNHSVTNAVPYAEEYRIRARDGAERIVVVSGVPVRDESGKVLEWIGTYTDVTEHRDTAAKLVQAQKMESLGRLAGGVAHDFNNLLTVISGYSDFLIADRPADDPVRQDAEQIRKAAARAALLTQQLLAFSRKQMRAPELIELNPRVREASTMLERLIGENIDLVLELSPDAGTVMVDVSQIDQLLMNLVINARDAMPDGGVIAIRTDRVVVADAHGTLARGDWTMLVVSDPGIGMSSEIRARAFEPFFTTKQTGSGTGLGLSTVYGIVRQSGGHVTLDSEPGRGTVVTISLPRVGSAEKKAVAPSTDIGRAGSETILLVEDEDGVRRLAREALERQGYRVLTASSADDALHLVRTEGERIDLVLTDVVMPGRSGAELVQTLTEEREGLRVLYMSGYTDDAILRHGVLEAGVNFIQKPFAPNDLARKVRDVLDRAPVAS
jgi:two-component system, cell cycle sensor histidine kinase and response regulator CckA